MQFATESLEAVLDEIIDLRATHPNLFPVSENSSFRIDDESFDRLSGTNSFHVTTARLDNQLVGFAVYLIHSLLHYANKQAATCSLSFMTEDALVELNGGAYARMIEASHVALKARGVFKVMHITKQDSPFPFEVPGYRQIETSHSKHLQEAF